MHLFSQTDDKHDFNSCETLQKFNVNFEVFTFKAFK